MNKFWGIFFIAAGAVFLLNNLGLLSISVWSVLWQFWPVIFIFWGLEIILGPGRTAELIVGAIAFLTVVFILIEVAVFDNNQFRQWVGRYMKWLPLNEQLFHYNQSPVPEFLNGNPSRTL